MPPAAAKRETDAGSQREPFRCWRIRWLMLNQFPDYPIDLLNRQGIETEGQQLTGALDLNGQGIDTLLQTFPVAQNIGFELLALVAHGSPSGSGGSNGLGGATRSLSSMG